MRGWGGESKRWSQGAWRENWDSQPSSLSPSVGGSSHGHAQPKEAYVKVVTYISKLDYFPSQSFHFYLKAEF